MKKRLKKFLTFVLAICMFVTSSVSAFANDTEVYLSELRIIYADSYDEAKEELEDSEFSDYKLLKDDLNKGSGKVGVYLAYKTTTNVEEAITDLSVIQMNGGYKEGNYEEMIKESFEEYVAMSETYMIAVEYFAEAYDAGHFLAECAYRQLNFYSDNEDHDGALLGDLFVEGIDEQELATIFMKGNVYALENIRTLLAQGVAYNEADESYMELISQAAAEMADDEAYFDDDGFEEWAHLVGQVVSGYSEQLQAYEKVKDTLNFEDEEVSDEEIEHLQAKALANQVEGVDYIDGSLYDFILNFEYDDETLYMLYPMMAALNDGQEALAKLGHFADVFRYSTTAIPEETMDEEITKLEEQYGENPFDIYTGVDLSIYEGSYALTSEAYRADACTEEGFWNNMFNMDTALRRGIEAGAFGVGLGLVAYGAYRSYQVSKIATEAFQAEMIADIDFFANKDFFVPTKWGNAMVEANGGVLALPVTFGPNFGYEDAVSHLVQKFNLDVPVDATFMEKYDVLAQYRATLGDSVDDVFTVTDEYLFDGIDDYVVTAKQDYIAEAGLNFSGAVTAAVYAVGGALMLASAISMVIDVINYYYPDYEDIPLALIDKIDTANGDRYIKYDAVLEALPQDDGDYAAGDLNGFSGLRWNALYYTKSYEAGKPLLAEFEVSYDNHIPGENYLPIHRFGEVICYNVNKYHRKGESIYVSVLQSENQKAAVEDVPNVVGSMVGTGYLFLAGGAGLLVGAAGMFGLMKLVKAKKKEK